MTNGEWFETALKRIGALPCGSVFELSELLRSAGWEDEPCGLRTDFGKYFARAVAGGRVPGVKAEPGGRNNHRFYRKFGE